MPSAQTSRAKEPAGRNTTSDSAQISLNHAVYESRGSQRHYLFETLFPPEIACLLKYQPWISGRDVLDIGVGMGRTTRYLAPLARRYEAVDFSSLMVREMKSAMPGISVNQADFRNLSLFQDASFDFVFAPNNVIDTLPHEGRLQALHETRRVLRPGGITAIASHNLKYHQAFSSPHLAWTADPFRLVFRFSQYLVSWRNYFRLKPLRRITPEYALINDGGHYFSLLHYYVSRSNMASQLHGTGLSLQDVFDSHGNPLPEGADESEDAALLYVARRNN